MVGIKSLKTSDISPSSGYQENSPLILITDDDELTRKLLSQSMRKEGYRVIEATNGEQCLESYMRFHPDLVLLDAIMPVMDGFNCCSVLSKLNEKQIAPDVPPILMITSLDDYNSVDQAFNYGATDYITKPIHWALLRQRVRRLLEASRATKELKYQTERERLTGAIAERIRQSLNLNDILYTAVEEIRQFLQTDRVLIYRFNPDGSGIVMVESVADSCLSILDRHIFDSCFNEKYIQLYKQGRIKAVDDIYNAGLQQCYIDFLADLQVRANLVVPLLQDDHLWGLLIAHHCTNTRLWERLEIELVQRLSIQLAIALQQSELYHKIQQLNTDLEVQVLERTAQLQQALKFESTLKRITDKVRDSLNESHILQTAVQELALALEANCCNATLYDWELKVHNLHNQYTTAISAEQAHLIDVVECPKIYQQLWQGQCLQFGMINSNSLEERVAIFACAMMNDRDLVGYLWVVNPPDRLLNDLEIRLVQQVASQCAIAIRQARLYQASQAHIVELEKLNHLKDDFLCTVSHELKTPIATIKMAAQMLDVIIHSNKDLVQREKALVQYLQILNTECDQEIKLIDDLLTLQQLEAGVEPLILSKIDLYTWIPEVMQPFEKRTANLQQSLELELPTNLRSLISNTFSLQRILTELLTNACKYTPAGENIVVSASDRITSIQISVANTGVEIPPQEMELIFDKFYRIPNSDPWKHGGIGLGLALVKRLVGYLGGSISVDSSLGQACFTVELPWVGNLKQIEAKLP